MSDDLDSVASLREAVGVGGVGSGASVGVHAPDYTGVEIGCQGAK